MAYDIKRDYDSEEYLTQEQRDNNRELDANREKVETIRLAALEIAGINTVSFPAMSVQGINVRFSRYGVNVSATIKTHRFIRTM